MYLTDEKEIEILKDIILNKAFFRNKGPEIKSQCDIFEKTFANRLGLNHSLLVTSGTNALIAALSSLNLTKEDEIIIPSFTFFATAAAVINANATPRIVNIDSTFSIDPVEVEGAITPKTKGIIAVHMDGHACNMDALLAITNKYNIPLIEDVAQACGGSYKGKSLGSLGKAGCFSFNVDKIISSGEGGAIVTNSREIYERCLCIQDTSCSFGITHKNSFTLIDPFIGQSMRVSELTGALMNTQLDKLDHILNELRVRKNIYQEVFKNFTSRIAPVNDIEGDCCTSMNFLFSDPIEVKEKFLELSKKNIHAIPQLNRPAHFCNQWINLLKKERPNGKYEKSNFLPSLELISKALKINIRFDLNLDETFQYVEAIKNIII